MFTKRVTLFFAGLLLVSVLAACAPVPPAAQAPELAATAAPVATAEPTATEVPVTPTPAAPDPKTNPQAALLHAAEGKLFRTAEFTYTMSMTMAPADDASAKALGEQAAQLTNLTMDIEGTGAMDVDPADPTKTKMRMDMDMNAAGQQAQLQMVVIGQDAWVKMPGQDEWIKAEGDQARNALPAGVSPDQMVEDFKNAVDAQWIEDVTLNGEELSHLRFTMDPAKLDLESLTSSLNQGQEMTAEEVQAIIKDMKPVIDVWLTRAGLELRAEQMKLDWIMPLPEAAQVGDAKIRFGMTMDMRLSHVNEPVTIEAPAE